VRDAVLGARVARDCRVLLSMARRQPGVLKGLVLYGLTPLAAELLTSRLEQDVDTTTPGEEGAADDDERFYRTFYGVFGDDPDEALRALVHNKEEFAADAMRAVTTALLGAYDDI
jgi:hypothetical protein